MKRQFILTAIIVLVTALVSSRASAPTVYANGEAISKWVIASGGGVSNGSNITLKDTIGEPVIGPSSAASTGLYAGFWYEVYHPTSITLASFTATSQSNGIQLRWITISEIGTVGFNVYRATSRTDTPIKLNADLIPSQTFGGMTGATYTYLDTNVISGTSYFYWLQEVLASGGSHYYGPITPSGIFLPLITR